MKLFSLSVFAVLAVLIMVSHSFADDTYVKIQEMMNDLGGPSKQKQNNDKILKCANGGTKKIKVSSSGGGTTYKGEYKSCREYGSTRDGNVEITVGGGGGSSEDEFALKKGEPESYSYEGDGDWHTTCNSNKSKCLAYSGNIEFSYDGRNGKLFGTYGIPKINKIAPDVFKKLNKLYNKNYTASTGENDNFFKWLSQQYVDNKGSWSACNREENKNKPLCDLSPSFDAAMKLVDYKNMNRMDELVTNYLIETKYYKDSGSEQIITSDKDNLLNLARWCSYAPCTEDSTKVLATTNGMPLKQKMSQSIDFLNTLSYLSSVPKSQNAPLKDGISGEVVADADEPFMYKQAYDSLYNRYINELNLIDSAKKLSGNIADVYLENYQPAMVRIVAQRLNKTYKLPLDKSYLNP